jgi:hypothetical protein
MYGFGAITMITNATCLEYVRSGEVGNNIGIFYGFSNFSILCILYRPFAVPDEGQSLVRKFAQYI